MWKCIVLLAVLLMGISCNQNSVEGYWEGVFYNEEISVNKDEESPVVNPYFQGMTKILPSVVFNKKKIEFPFGFEGWNSLSLKDNFRIYELKEKELIIFEDDGISVFELRFLSPDSICILVDNISIICFNRKSIPLPCDFKEIEFKIKDEHIEHNLQIYQDGTFFLSRKGVKQDSISDNLGFDNFEYVKKLVNRVKFIDINQETSDVPDYYLKVRCGEKVDSFTFSGLQNLPYDLRALLYNLEKLTKSDYPR